MTTTLPNLVRTAADPATTLNRKPLASVKAWEAALNRADADASKRLAILGHLNGPPTINDARGTTRPPAAHAPFAQQLNDEVAARSTSTMPADKRDALERSSQTLVNQFFMGSMLKQMRDSPFKSEMFNGGKGGDAYAGLFDQHLTERAGGRIAKGLVSSMVRQYERATVGAGVATPGTPDPLRTLNAATTAGRVRP